jgi:hypothetical protein
LPKCNAGHAQMTEAERTEDDAETALWDRALEDPWATNEARGALARPIRPSHRHQQAVQRPALSPVRGCVQRVACRPGDWGARHYPAEKTALARPHCAARRGFVQRAGRSRAGANCAEEAPELALGERRASYDAQGVDDRAPAARSGRSWRLRRRVMSSVPTGTAAATFAPRPRDRSTELGTV